MEREGSPQLKLLLQTHNGRQEENPGFRARRAAVQIPSQPPHHLRDLGQIFFFPILFIYKERLTVNSSSKSI